MILYKKILKFSNTVAIIACLVLFFGILPVYAADTTPPEIEWDKQYDFAIGSTAFAVVQQTSDSGFVYLGNGVSNIILLKLDVSGNVQWKSELGEGKSYGRFLDQTSDGGYIVVGYTKTTTPTSARDIFLYKLDSNGNLLWEKTFSNGSWMYGSAVLQTNDGGYIIAGSIGDAAARDAFLMKTDALGNEEWRMNYGGSGDDQAFSAEIEGDGYIFTGTTTSFGDGSTDVYVVKTGFDGSVRWYRNFGSSGAERNSSIKKTTDGGYIISGFVQPSGYGPEQTNAYVIKIGSSGELQWERILDFGNGRDQSFSAFQAKDGGYIVSGRTNSFSSDVQDDDIFITKLNADGATLWNKFVGQDGRNITGGFSEPTQDGGFIVAGFYKSSSTITYLAKIRPTSPNTSPYIRHEGLVTNIDVQQGEKFRLSGTVFSNRLITRVSLDVDQITQYVYDMPNSYSFNLDTFELDTLSETLNGLGQHEINVYVQISDLINPAKIGTINLVIKVPESPPVLNDCNGPLQIGQGGIIKLPGYITSNDTITKVTAGIAGRDGELGAIASNSNYFEMNQFEIDTSKNFLYFPGTYEVVIKASTSRSSEMIEIGRMNLEVVSSSNPPPLQVLPDGIDEWATDGKRVVWAMWEGSQYNIYEYEFPDMVVKKVTSAENLTDLRLINNRIFWVDETNRCIRVFDFSTNTETLLLKSANLEQSGSFKYAVSGDKVVIKSDNHIDDKRLEVYDFISQKSTYYPINNKYYVYDLQFCGDKVVWTDLILNSYGTNYYDIHVLDTTTHKDQIIAADRLAGPWTDQRGVKVLMFGTKIVWHELKHSNNWVGMEIPGWQRDINMFDLVTGETTEVVADEFDQHLIGIEDNKIIWQNSDPSNKDVYKFDFNANQTMKVAEASWGAGTTSFYLNNLFYLDGWGHLVMKDLVSEEVKTIELIDCDNYLDDRVDYNIPFQDKVFWGQYNTDNVKPFRVYLENLPTVTPETFKVSGEVTYKGSGLSGVLVKFSRIKGMGTIPDAVYTDQEGNWIQTGFEIGTTYRLVLNKDEYIFKPSFMDFTGEHTALSFSAEDKPAIDFVKVSDQISSYNVTSLGETFYKKELCVDYSEGNVWLSGTGDGITGLWVEDEIVITVVHEDGTSTSSSYLVGGSEENLQPRLNITSLFKPGRNDVTVVLKDLNGGNVGTSSLWITTVTPHTVIENLPLKITVLPLQRINLTGLIKSNSPLQKITLEFINEYGSNKQISFTSSANPDLFTGNEFDLSKVSLEDLGDGSWLPGECWITIYSKNVDSTVGVEIGRTCIVTVDPIATKNLKYIPQRDKWLLTAKIDSETLLNNGGTLPEAVYVAIFDKDCGNWVGVDFKRLSSIGGYNYELEIPAIDFNHRLETYQFALLAHGYFDMELMKASANEKWLRGYMEKQLQQSFTVIAQNNWGVQYNKSTGKFEAWVDWNKPEAPHFRLFAVDGIGRIVTEGKDTVIYWDPSKNKYFWSWKINNIGLAVGNSYKFGIKEFTFEDQWSPLFFKTETLTNQIPVAKFNYWIVNGTTVQFNNTSYDPDGWINNYYWNFGDSTSSEFKNPTHTFPSNGTWNVSLTIEDNLGEVHYISKEVFINTSLSGAPAENNVVTIQSPRGTTGKSILDPVDSATGAHVLDRTFLKLNGGQTLEFHLHYNSLLLSEGIFGKGWGSDFESRLDFVSDNHVVVNWSANHRNHFISSDSLKFTSPDFLTQYDVLVKNSDGSYTLTKRNKYVFHFNSSGLLLSKVNPKGLSIFISYDNIGRPIKITDSISGHSLQYSYNEIGFVSTVTDDLNRKILINYDNHHNLVGIIDASGSPTNYTYDDNGRILTGTDALGRPVFTNTYDELGRVIIQEDGNQDNLPARFSYDENSNPGKIITAVLDRNGHKKTYTHNRHYQLLSVQGETGHLLENYTYDDQGNLTTATDALGNLNTYSYDLNGNLIEIIDPNGRLTKITYDGNNNIFTVTNAVYKTATFTYDQRSNITSIKDFSGKKASFEYDENGLLSKVVSSSGIAYNYNYVKGIVSEIINPSGNLTTYKYDDAGRIIKISDIYGNSTVFSYDENDNVLSINDPLGNKISFTYNWNNNMVSRVDAKGNVKLYSYNENGRVSTVTDALNNVVTYGYDDEDHLIKITDAKGNKTCLEYDALGRVVSIVDALGNKKFIEYDAVGNVIGKIDAAGNKIFTAQYDSIGNLVATSDAVGNSFNFEYDILNRLVSLRDPVGNITEFYYDEINRLLGSTDSVGGKSIREFDDSGNIVVNRDSNGNKTNFTYDLAGRLIKNSDPLGNFISYNYNDQDLISKIINARGQVTELQYDSIGRIKQLTDEAGKLSYDYDLNGNVISVSDENGINIREYDALNRVIKYTDFRGNSIGYQYDANGNLSVLTYPDGKKVTYEYDALNRLTGVTDWNERRTTYEYDSNSRLIKTIHSNGTQQCSEYNKLGQLIRKTEIIKDEIITGYNFSYDSTGNIVSERNVFETDPSELRNTTMTYTDGNRLASYNEQPVSHDGDGNMINGPLGSKMIGYVFDSRNRLVSAGDVRYSYDSENNRMSVTEATYQTNYVINPNAILSQVLVQTTSDGKQTYFVYGLGLISQEDETGRYTVYHYDNKGNTVALTDESGNITDRFQYAPFGEIIQRTGITITPFLYNGRYGVMTDSNGLYYMRSRYYNPELKRWVSQDVVQGKITSSQSLNRYAFVESNPVKYVDPWGYWKSNIHDSMTFRWATEVGFSGSAANWIAQWDDATDLIKQPAYEGLDVLQNKEILDQWESMINGTLDPMESNHSWHYNLGPAFGLGYDTRQKHADDQFKKAVAMYDDHPWEALAVLGMGLHALQDIPAHLDQGADIGIGGILQGGPHLGIVEKYDDPAYYPVYKPIWKLSPAGAVLTQGRTWEEDPSGYSYRYWETRRLTEEYLSNFINAVK